MFYLYVNKYVAWKSRLYIFSHFKLPMYPIFKQKIQLSGCSAYSDDSQSQLIRIKGILTYLASLIFESRRLRNASLRIRGIESKKAAIFLNSGFFLKKKVKESSFS